MALENAKLKLLKLMSSYNNVLSDNYNLSFLQHPTLETWNLWIFSAKCDLDGSVSICPRFYAHFSLIRFRLRNGDTYGYTFVKMSSWGGGGELYHYSVFARLESYWNVHISFFASYGSPWLNLISTYK